MHRSVTPLMQKKLDNYLAVLALMCDNFTVDVNLLAEDLQMAARLCVGAPSLASPEPDAAQALRLLPRSRLQAHDPVGGRV